MTAVLIRRSCRDTGTQTHKEGHVQTGGRNGDNAASQGLTKAVGDHQKLGRGRKHPSQSLQRERGPAHTLLLDF